MTVAIILTSQDAFPDTDRETGVWLEEFLIPYYAFVDADIPVRLASPRGNKAPIDPSSVEAIKDTELYRRFSRDQALLDALDATEKLATVDPSTVNAILYPGGYGPVFDLRNDPHSVRLIEVTYEAGRPVATICHAGCVLLEAKTPSGVSLVQGRELTAFSDSEEIAVNMENAVPYLVETELKRLVASYSKADDWQEYCVTDGALITGQNPASSAAVAQSVIAFLKSPRHV